MNVKKFYCGMMLVSVKGIYACIDKYTSEIKCTGSFEKCDEYFNGYVKGVSENDT